MAREQKAYVLKKYVLAVSAQDAISKDKKHPVDEIVLDEDTKQPQELTPAIGFQTDDEEWTDEMCDVPETKKKQHGRQSTNNRRSYTRNVRAKKAR